MRNSLMWLQHAVLSRVDKNYINSPIRYFLESCECILAACDVTVSVKIEHQHLTRVHRHVCCPISTVL
jgi:hypothetical protein